MIGFFHSEGGGQHQMMNVDLRTEAAFSQLTSLFIQIDMELNR
jgi:hypothetical protein